MSARNLLTTPRNNLANLVEEKISRKGGEVYTRVYKRGSFLGKGGFARCYEFTASDTRKIFACKIISKERLTKSRARQKLRSEI